MSPTSWNPVDADSSDPSPARPIVAVTLGGLSGAAAVVPAALVFAVHFDFLITFAAVMMGACGIAVALSGWAYRRRRGFTAHLMRLNPSLHRPVFCSWFPDSLGAVALPVVLAASLVAVIVSIHRERDWLPWGMAIAVFCAFALRASWKWRYERSGAAEFPDWATVLLLVTCVLTIAAMGIWRTGRPLNRHPLGTVPEDPNG